MSAVLKSLRLCDTWFCNLCLGTFPTPYTQTSEHSDIRTSMGLFNTVFLKHFQLVSPLTYWATGHCSPLGLQFYTLFRALVFPWRFCGSHGCFFVALWEATAHSLGSIAFIDSQNIETAVVHLLYAPSRKPLTEVAFPAITA